jgi:peptidoglycan/xylan/chitin deacetylase (PgdA/CDA1 family)
VTSHSAYKVGVYSSPGVWQSIFGTGTASSIPSTYEWTYLDDTSSLAHPPSGWCLEDTSTCARFFGGITSRSKYALMWQWSGGGPYNGYGGFDQIDAASQKASDPTAAIFPVPAGLGGTNWTTVRAANKIVALTFDGGAGAQAVDSILGTLKTQHVPATFFLTGDFVRDFPAKARAIAAAGERVGDHSDSHPHFILDHLTDSQMRAQVLDARQQIISAAGTDPWPWFRFPFGEFNAHAISVVNSVGFVPIGWTVDTLGWKGAKGTGITVTTIVDRVLANLKPGEIVLMHVGAAPDGTTLDAAALPSIIRELKARGFSFVTMDAMLGYRVLTSNGDVRAFGSASFGTAVGKLSAGVTTTAIAASRNTGG